MSDKEIRLNKPLYKEDGGGPPAASGGAGAPSAPLPRPARPMILARAGAFVIDVLVLHGLLLGVIKLWHEGIVQLRLAGPWVGLLLGWVYFALGSGPLTGGRTLGKLIVRVRVADLSGPDLPAGRAALRAALLLWPGLLSTLLSQMSEARYNAGVLSIWPIVPLLGWAVILGWFAGNSVFAAVDPHGRTWYDRFTGSIAVALDASAEDQGDFVRSARETTDPARLRKSRLYLWLIVGGLAGLVLFWLQQQHRYLQQSPEWLNGLRTRQQELQIPGFARPFVYDEASRPGSAPAATQASDPGTSTLVFLYTARRPLDAKALEADPSVRGVVDRISDYQRLEVRVFREQERLERAKRAKTAEPAAPPPVSMADRMPRKLQIRAAFAEFSDLFFAWNASEVFSIGKKVDLADVLAIIDEPTTGSQSGKPAASATTATPDRPTTPTSAPR